MRIAIRLPALAAGVAALAFVAPAFAQEGGSVTGTFVLKGKAPKLPTPTVTKDQAVCKSPPVQSEALVVDPDSNGIANVFVWIAKVDEKDIPADLKEPKEAEISIDNRGCMFVPHCFVARTGQTLVMLNDDAVAHNVHTNPVKGKAINDLVAPNDREGVKRPLDKAELLPIPVVCDIHPWMKAHMLVLDHPYSAVSDAKGTFTIEGLPPGKHTFKVWQESAGYLRKLPVEDIVIEAGKATDLGKIEVDLAAFKNLPK